MDRVSEHRKRTRLAQRTAQAQAAVTREAACPHGCRPTVLTERTHGGGHGFHKVAPDPWAVPVLRIRRGCPVHDEETNQ